MEYSKEQTDVVILHDDKVVAVHEKPKLSAIFSVIFSGKQKPTCPWECLCPSYWAIIFPKQDQNIKTKIPTTHSPPFSNLGFALLSDGYQVGVLSLVNVCFTKIYGDQFTSAMSTRIGNSLFVGCIIGQIGFGFICDRVGRKVGLMLTTFLVILGAALCAGSYGHNGSVEGMFWALTVYRGILGVGVGGEYPCSSASASEAADVVMPGRRGL